MVTLLLAVAFAQDNEQGYSEAVKANLKRVESFLLTCDEITTSASHRVLESYPELEANRKSLLTGQPIQATQSAQFKTQTLKGNDRTKAAAFFNELTKPPIQGPAKCFFPRHSIFATKQGTWIEIQICYECATLRVDSKDKSIRLYLGINPNSRKSADKFFGFVSNNSKA